VPPTERRTPCHPRPQREFGFTLEGRAIIVDDARVRAVGTRTWLPAAEEARKQPGKATVLL
jgi:hypothetical protein